MSRRSASGIQRMVTLRPSPKRCNVTQRSTWHPNTRCDPAVPAPATTAPTAAATTAAATTTTATATRFGGRRGGADRNPRYSNDLDEVHSDDRQGSEQVSQD